MTSTELQRQITENALTTQRVYSIDALRGITILVMIIVNEVAGVSGLPSWLKHAGAEDDTMTFVDVVFPAFLFIVGMSIPFAVAARIAKGDNLKQILVHVGFRGLALIILGVFMVNAESGYNETAMRISIGWWSVLFVVFAVMIWNKYFFKKIVYARLLKAVGIIGLIVLAPIYKGGDNGEAGMSPQWWGILGLIGWAYLISVLIYICVKGRTLWICLSPVVFLSLYIIGTEFPDMFPFIYAQRGHIIHSMIVLIGTSLTMLIFDHQVLSLTKQRIFTVILYCVACLLLGLLLRSSYQISKIYATPTWALYSSFCCCVIYLILYWITDIRNFRNWANFFKPAATNSLLIYLLPFTIFYLMKATHLAWPAVFGYGLAGLLWSITYALMLMLLVRLLNRAHIKLQL